jgi:hypothetical protein
MLVYNSFEEVKADIESQVLANVAEYVLLEETDNTNHNAFNEEHSTPEVTIWWKGFTVGGAHQDEHQLWENEAKQGECKCIDSCNQEGRVSHPFRMIIRHNASEAHAFLFILDLLGSSLRFLLNSKLFLELQLLLIIKVVFILTANLISEFLFLGLLVIVLLMSIVLLLKPLYNIFVLLSTFSSSEHRVFRFKVKEILGSHNSLKSMSNHDNCELSSIGSWVLSDLIDGTLYFLLTSWVKSTSSLVQN